MRLGIVFFVLAKLRLPRLDLPDIADNIAALRRDTRRELARRVILAQRFQADEPVRIWMPYCDVFPLFVEPDFISAPAQHFPKFIYGA